MGLFNVSTNQPVEITAKQIYLEYGSILAEREEIEKAIKVDKEKFIFTNYRLILVLLYKGDKYEFLSVPYSSIRKFSKVSKEVKDLNAELNIYLIHEDKPIKKILKNCEFINDVYKLLSKYMYKLNIPVEKELQSLKLN
ncbi:MAG: PH domain-containing protein [Pyrinomonadaceae bacterium]|nr:PH domain-containing protein [Sphingobacteriaceae bacterium]